MNTIQHNSIKMPIGLDQLLSDCHIKQHMVNFTKTAFTVVLLYWTALD